jgi:hypothetical protein
VWTWDPFVKLFREWSMTAPGGNDGCVSSIVRFVRMYVARGNFRVRRYERLDCETEPSHLSWHEKDTASFYQPQLHSNQRRYKKTKEHWASWIKRDILEKWSKVKGESEHAESPMLIGALDSDMSGQRLLNTWKEEAGKSKSWRRSPKITIEASQRRMQPQLRHQDCDYRLYKSPLWIPSAFLRLGDVPKPAQIERPICISKSKETSSVETFTKSNRVGYSAPLWKSDMLMDLEDQVYTITCDESYEPWPEPSSGLIRIVFGTVEFSPNCVWRCDRFLPIGLQLPNGWCFESFVRNDPLVDVYSLLCDMKRPSIHYEAHVFLDEYHGKNARVCVQNRQKRLEADGNYIEYFFHNDRRVIVVGTRNQVEDFKLPKTRKSSHGWLIKGNGSRGHASIERPCGRSLHI